MESNPYPKEIVFVRHARSRGNDLTVAERAKLNIGTTAYELTDVGEQQGLHTRDWLGIHFPTPDRILRSYYARTKRTADICYPDMEKREEPLLAEANRGIYSVLTHDEILRHMPWEIERRNRDGLYHHCPQGGENWPMIENRIRDFRRSIRAHYPGKTIVVFGHGFWILLWQKLIHHWTIEETERRYRNDEIVANASVLIYRNEWREDIGRNVLRHDPATDYVVPWLGKL